MPTYEIDSYSVRLWSSRPTTNLDPEVPVAGVYLFEGATYRGYVYFHPDGTPLSPPVIDAASGQVFLSFNLSQLGPDNVGLMTGQEPTGEEEGPGG